LLSGQSLRNGSPWQSTTLVEDRQAWEGLTRGLAKRSVSHALARRLGANAPFLSWGWPCDPSSEIADTVRVAAELAAWTPGRKNAHGEAPAESLDRWLAAGPSDAAAPEAVLESLAWAHGLALCAASLEPAAWLAGLEKLVHTAEEAAPSHAKNLLAAALFSAELPATLAYWFPEFAVCAELAGPGREAAIQCLEEATDAEGVIHASYLPWLRPLLASWSRLAAMDEVQRRAERSKAAAPRFADQPRFAKAIGQALRLTRPDGSQALSLSATTTQSTATTSLFAAALKFADQPARRIAALALPKALESKPAAGAKTKSAAKAKGPARTAPSPAFNSELSQLAVLRPGWKTADPRLTVAYDKQQIRAELACGRELVASGAWNPEIEWNGTSLKPASEWEEVCWTSDDDVDYLELEISLTGDVRVQRHILLAREDRFLLVADAILGQRPGRISYRSALPLTSAARFLPAKESHEGQLACSGVCGLALPLALPEWRSAASCGSLSAIDGQLVLQQSAEKSQAMFAPLLIDLSPRRLSKPFTWRQLTVAENRQILPRDAAVGYRVQLGAQQWMIYRSLGQRGNRTLLGHNLVSEFLVARFPRSGVVESLLEIEGPAE
jgi:hypothetical protein